MAIQDREGNLIMSKSPIKQKYTEYYSELLKPREPEEEAINS